MTCSGKPTFPALENFVDIFRTSISSFGRLCAADPSRPDADRQRGTQQFASAYLSILNEIERKALGACSSDDSSDGNAALGCLELCRLRWGIQGKHLAVLVARHKPLGVPTASPCPHLVGSVIVMRVGTAAGRRR